MEKGYWHKCLMEAMKVGEIYMCPFAAFARKHGYDLKYDNLIFPRAVPEFKCMELKYKYALGGSPYGGWDRQYSIWYNLPSNVTIGEVFPLKKMTMQIYKDKVMLVKFCQNTHIDGDLDDLFD